MNATRCTVLPLTAARPNRSGIWWTTMVTAMPARKPVMIGAERSSAIHPRRSSHTSATNTPTATARIPTRSTYWANQPAPGAQPRRRTAGRSSSPRRPTSADWIPKSRTAPCRRRMRKSPCIGGIAASREVASCSGTAITSSVSAASKSAGAHDRLYPRNDEKSTTVGSNRPSRSLNARQHDAFIIVHSDERSTDRDPD